MTDNTVAYVVLAKRIEQIGEHRDHLKMLQQTAITLPPDERAEIAEKIGKVADLLAAEIEQLRAWNLLHATKH